MHSLKKDKSPPIFVKGIVLHFVSVHFQANHIKTNVSKSVE
jgi:hypothetical protein